MSVSRILSKLPSGLASNTGKLLSVNASGEFEFRSDIASANTIYLFGALNQTNTNIVAANTQLKSYTDGAINSANTQLKAYTDGAISSANTQLKSYTDGAITLANTQLKSYTDGYINSILDFIGNVDSAQNTKIANVESNTIYLFGALNQTNTNIVAANTQLKSYVDGQISYIVDINNTQNTNISNASNLAQGAYDTANLKFNTSGGNITGPVTISANLTVTGNLTVAGNVTTVSANNLILKDNMIYLNDGNTVADPDLGIAGNYNDGIYRHAGFFRDASDGYWKVYDQYLPEPDASPYIDTSDSSFRIADFQANNVTLGKITTSSTLLVSNLNSDYLDGQHGIYYTGYTDSANTQLKSYIDGKSIYIGTTSIAFNRSSDTQTLSGVNIDGSAGSIVTSANIQVNTIGVNTTPDTANTGSIRATGQITAYYSDEKLKTKLGNIENAIEKVRSLNGFYYEPNLTAQEFGYEIKREVGLSAQEVQRVLPEVVVPAPIDDKYLTIHYERLVPLLVEAIKEQQKQIDELKSRT